MTLGLAVDILVAGLLATAIVWAFVLDRRLRELKSGKDGVKQAVLDLAGAAGRAEAAVASLRQAADSAGAQLASAQARAKGAAEELSMLVGAAEGLADRLTDRARHAARPTTGASTGPVQMRELRGAR